MNKNTNLNKNVNHSFLLPFILETLDLNIPEDAALIKSANKKTRSF